MHISIQNNRLLKKSRGCDNSAFINPGMQSYEFQKMGLSFCYYWPFTARHTTRERAQHCWRFGLASHFQIQTMTKINICKSNMSNIKYPILYVLSLMIVWQLELDSRVWVQPYRTCGTRQTLYYLYKLWLVLKMGSSSNGLTGPRVPMSPREASPQVQKVGLLPALVETMPHYFLARGHNGENVFLLFMSIPNCML